MVVRSCRFVSSDYCIFIWEEEKEEQSLILFPQPDINVTGAGEIIKFLRLVFLPGYVQYVLFLLYTIR